MASQATGSAASSARWVRPAISAALLAYTWLLVAIQPTATPDWLRRAAMESRRAIGASLRGLAADVIGQPLGNEASFAVYLAVVFGAVPLLALLVAGARSPGSIGLCPPNRLGWRLVLAAIALGAPFQVWMVRGSEFATPYLRQWHRLGPAAFFAYYFAIMAAEHFFCHGAVVVLTRPDRRWSAPNEFPPGAARPRGLLTWLGFRRPVGDGRGFARFTRWCGLSDGSVLPIAVSALVFGMVHLGKHPRELLLSFPGGVVIVFLALRCNSWFVPFMIHAGTASTALMLMLMLS